jgi:hypothetical protein
MMVMLVILAAIDFCARLGGPPPATAAKGCQLADPSPMQLSNQRKMINRDAARNRVRVLAEAVIVAIDETFPRFI